MPKSRLKEFWGKLGKKPARRDARNFKFADIVKGHPWLPKSYDFDERYIAVPTPTFANDRHPDCVIAGRAHQTLRFEYLDQRRIIPIADRDVLKEWHRENGDTKRQLVVLQSMKEWRRRGWRIQGHTYKIKAFTELNRAHHLEIRRAIVMQVGVGLGLRLPYSAFTQFQAGKPWEVVAGVLGEPDPGGGHYVYCPGYTEVGPVCVTWGRKQPMSWRFFDRYCDEAYAIVDARDTKFKAATGLGGRIDHDKLDSLLRGHDPSSGCR